MSFKGTIVFRKKDAMIPEAFLELVFKENSAFLSSAFIDTDKTMSMDAIADHALSDINDAQELVKDRDSIFFLGNFKEPEESLQPFVVLENDKGEPILTAFLDGDFSNYADAKSANSDAFHALNKYFRPRIEKWFKKGGLDNVLDELDDAATKEDIRNTFMGRGAILFFAVNGKHIFVQNKNPEYAEYPWGFTTNSHGYKEEAAKTSVPVAGPKKFAKFGKKNTEQVNTEAANDKVSSKSSTDGAEAPPPTAKAADSGPAEEKQETKTIATVAEASSGTVVGWKPEFHVGIERKQKIKLYKASPIYALWLEQSRAEKKKVIESDGVWLPEGYKNQVPLFATVPSDQLANYLADGCYVKDSSVKVTNGKKTEQGYPERLPAEQVEQNRANKDTAPKNIPQADSGYVPFEEHKPEVNEELRKWFSEATKNKFIAVGSQEVALDPAKLQSLEKNIPSAIAASGMALEDFFRISRAGHNDLAHKFPVWYAGVMCEILPKLVKAGILTKPSPTEPAKEPETSEEKPPISTVKRPQFGPRKKVA